MPVTRLTMIALSIEAHSYITWLPTIYFNFSHVVCLHCKIVFSHFTHSKSVIVTTIILNFVCDNEPH
jgi:hypothetical protein